MGQPMCILKHWMSGIRIIKYWYHNAGAYSRLYIQVLHYIKFCLTDHSELPSTIPLYIIVSFFMPAQYIHALNYGWIFSWFYPYIFLQTEPLWRLLFEIIYISKYRKLEDYLKDFVDQLKQGKWESSQCFVISPLKQLHSRFMLKYFLPYIELKICISVTVKKNMNLFLCCSKWRKRKKNAGSMIGILDIHFSKKNC